MLHQDMIRVKGISLIANITTTDVPTFCKLQVDANFGAAKEGNRYPRF